MLVMAALLLTLLHIDYGGSWDFHENDTHLHCQHLNAFFIDSLSLGGEGGGGIFTAQKSPGNHTKRGQVNAQQAFVPIHSSTPPPPSIPHSELLCAMNLSVLEQLFKSRSLGYRFRAVVVGS